MTDDDPSLVRRLVSGDKAALATAFDRFAPVLTRYAWAVCATPADVEHVVQESFLSLWKNADGLNLPTGRVLPWLLAVCRSHAGPRGADVAGGEPLRLVQQDLLALPDTDRRLVELLPRRGSNVVGGRAVAWSSSRRDPAATGSRATKEVQR
ncbi:sigma factor [Curtobacterium flaccumfaciens]|nr:sigma factor [Curtobacterium flaccumfaciens]